MSPRLLYQVEGTLQEPFDASLIESSLPVARLTPRYVARLPYWPSYRGASTEQRRKYLEWLKSGRSEPDIELGYVFIYFYGLERRVLVDGADHGPGIDELIRLLSIYRSSNSFRRYAASLLWITLLTAPADVLPAGAVEKVIAATDHWSEDHLAAMLAVCYRENRALPVDIAFLIAEHDPRSPRSVVTRRHPEKFRELFAQRYHAQCGHGVTPSCGEAG